MTIPKLKQTLQDAALEREEWSKEANERVQKSLNQNIVGRGRFCARQLNSEGTFLLAMAGGKSPRKRSFEPACLDGDVGKMGIQDRDVGQCGAQTSSDLEKKSRLPAQTIDAAGRQCRERVGSEKRGVGD